MITCKKCKKPIAIELEQDKATDPKYYCATCNKKLTEKEVSCDCLECTGNPLNIPF